MSGWNQKARDAALEVRRERQAEYDSQLRTAIATARTEGYMNIPPVGEPGSTTWERTAKPWRQIAEDLNQQGIPTPRQAAERHNDPEHQVEIWPGWTHVQVRRIARRLGIH